MGKQIDYNAAVAMAEFYRGKTGIVEAVPVKALNQLANVKGPETNRMTPMEAWSNISSRLAELDLRDGYTNDDIMAQCIAFKALREMEKKKDESD